MPNFLEVRNAKNNLREIEYHISWINQLDVDTMTAESYNRISDYALITNNTRLTKVLSMYYEYSRRKEYENNLHQNNLDIIIKMNEYYIKITNPLKELGLLKAKSTVNEGTLNYQAIQDLFYTSLSTLVSYLGSFANDLVLTNMNDANKLLLGYNFTNIFLRLPLATNITLFNKNRTMCPNQVRRAQIDNLNITFIQDTTNNFTYYGFLLSDNIKINYIPKIALKLFVKSSNNYLQINNNSNYDSNNTYYDINQGTTNQPIYQILTSITSDNQFSIKQSCQLYTVSTSFGAFTHYRLESNYINRYIPKNSLLLYNNNYILYVDNGQNNIAEYIYYNKFQYDPTASYPSYALVSSIPSDALVVESTIIPIGTWYLSPDTLNANLRDYQVATLLVELLNNNSLLNIDTTTENFTFTLNHASILLRMYNQFTCKLNNYIIINGFPENGNNYDDYLDLLVESTNSILSDLNIKISQLSSLEHIFMNLNADINIKNETYINMFNDVKKKEVDRLLILKYQCADTINLLLAGD